jgi:hypothetical protein
MKGVPMACELKTRHGVVSSDQEATMAAMRIDGWRVRVCRTFEEFKAWLDDEGNNKHKNDEDKASETERGR